VHIVLIHIKLNIKNNSAHCFDSYKIKFFHGGKEINFGLLT